MTTEPTLTTVPCHMETSITGGRDMTSRAWLGPRIELLKRFCLPSMQAQSSGYEWLVWLDPRTPAHATHLITTRLDNDDALADRYLRAVRAALEHKVDAFVNFPLGYQWRDGQLYFSVHRSNPFLSYVEPLERARENLGIRNVWNGNHDWARHAGRLIQVWTRPMWLQVLHGGKCGERIARSASKSDVTTCWIRDLPLVDESWMERHCDVARSVSHVLALPWRRREAVLRRLRRVGQ